MDSDTRADFDELNHRPVVEPGALVEPVETSSDDGLVSRLAVIEDQPLEARAAAYAQLHDELQGRLEGGDLPRSVG